MIAGMAHWPLIIEVGMTDCKGRRGAWTEVRDDSGDSTAVRAP